MPATDFLFARPNFWSGFASALDFFGVFLTYNKSPSPMAADAHASRSDWAITGSDLWRGIEWKQRELKERQQKLFEL